MPLVGYDSAAGSYCMLVQRHTWRFMRVSTLKFWQLLQPCQKASSEVSSEYVVGLYPRSEMIFIPAALVVMQNNLGSTPFLVGKLTCGRFRGKDPGLRGESKWR